MGFLPDWLQQLADTAPEGEAEIMLDNKMAAQVAADRRYRAAQKAKGIVRKTVLCPVERVTELQEMLRQWRAEL